MVLGNLVIETTGGLFWQYWNCTGWKQVRDASSWPGMRFLLGKVTWITHVSKSTSLALSSVVSSSWGELYNAAGDRRPWIQASSWQWCTESLRRVRLWSNREAQTSSWPWSSPQSQDWIHRAGCWEWCSLTKESSTEMSGTLGAWLTARPHNKVTEWGPRPQPLGPYAQLLVERGRQLPKQHVDHPLSFLLTIARKPDDSPVLLPQITSMGLW